MDVHVESAREWLGNPESMARWLEGGIGVRRREG
jgi:hypothetical protein